jgi:hypothetical protein
LGPGFADGWPQGATDKRQDHGITRLTPADPRFCGGNFLH